MLPRVLCASLFVGCAIDLLPAQTATATPYGNGCYFGRRSFYEMFGNGIPFDLAGTVAQPGGFSLLSIGTGFLMLPLSTSWHPQGSGAFSLPLTDDSARTVLLGFSLPLPSGPTALITVCSNGFVYLHAGTATPFVPTVGGLLSGDETLAAVFTDLDPSVGGSVTFETTPAAAYLTFDSVPEFAGSATATFQIAFRAFGQIDVLYGPVTLAARARLVGYSPGSGSLDPGARDLSAGVTFLTDGRDDNPVTLAASGRPVIGTSMSLTVGSIPAGGTGALLAIGAQQIAAGIDLASIGMSGCNQYATLDSVSLQPSALGTSVFPIAVPNAPTLLGVAAFAQGAASAPGRNSLQWVSTNGIALRIGAQ